MRRSQITSIEYGLFFLGECFVVFAGLQDITPYELPHFSWMIVLWDPDLCISGSDWPVGIVLNGIFGRTELLAVFLLYLYGYQIWKFLFSIRLALRYRTPSQLLQPMSLVIVLTLHKKWNFPLRISSLNVTIFAGNCGFGHI